MFEFVRNVTPTTDDHRQVAPIYSSDTPARTRQWPWARVFGAQFVAGDSDTIWVIPRELTVDDF